MRSDWMPLSASALVIGVMALVFGSLLNPADGRGELRRHHADRHPGGRPLARHGGHVLRLVRRAHARPAVGAVAVHDARTAASVCSRSRVFSIGVIGTSGYAMLLVFFRALVKAGAVEDAKLEQVTSDNGLEHLPLRLDRGLLRRAALLAIALFLAKQTPTWMPIAAAGLRRAVPVQRADRQGRPGRPGDGPRGGVHRHRDRRGQPGAQQRRRGPRAQLLPPRRVASRAPAAGRTRSARGVRVHRTSGQPGRPAHRAQPAGDRHDHEAADAQLVHQRVRALRSPRRRPGSGRTAPRRAARARRGPPARSAPRGRPARPGSPGRIHQLGHDLDAEDRALRPRQVRQQRGRPARAAAHVEHLVAGRGPRAARAGAARSSAGCWSGRGRSRAAGRGRRTASPWGRNRRAAASRAKASTMRCVGHGSAVTHRRPGAGLGGLDVAVLGRGRGGQPLEQPPGGLRHLGDGRSNASWLACEGRVAPLTLRTYCSAAAWTSSRVAGGSKLWRVRMLRHMPPSYAGPPAGRLRPTRQPRSRSARPGRRWPLGRRRRGRVRTARPPSGGASTTGRVQRAVRTDAQGDQLARCRCSSSPRT